MLQDPTPSISSFFHLFSGLPPKSLKKEHGRVENVVKRKEEIRKK